MNKSSYALRPKTSFNCFSANSACSVAAFFTTKGATVLRPTLTANDRGVCYLDTSLSAQGKPIWWTGTVWVDAFGASV